VALGGFKYEAERGSTQSTSSPASTISRGNYSYTLQISGDIRNRFYYNIGSGIENNGLFGLAGTPRASVAYYLARPSATGWFSGTKLHASFGKGIKEPDVFQQGSSLFDILSEVPDGSELIAQFHVGQIGPENSRTYDGGVDQELWNGRARLGLTYFHNEFTNGIEFVPQSGLAELGIPHNLLPAVEFGAYVNSEAFRSMGLELEAEYKINSRLFARGGYTYTDAVVQRSFSSDQGVGESFNPAFNFGNIPIGTIVHNIELKIGKGGQIARSAGAYAQIVGRDQDYVILRLNSAEQRLAHGRCMATVGAVSNPDHMNTSIGKAGRTRWLGWRPHNRGVSMNPIDHPHGGGEGRTSGGRHPVTPWGFPTKGKKTRKNKSTTKFILASRHVRKKK